MMNNKISLPVIKRLPKYYRYVSNMKRNNIVTVSSSELASMMGTTASQVRQDFNCFGGFGQQGIGYNVESLCHELESLLFSGKELTTILIGTGKLGRAISHFLAADAQGYRLMAAFDASPAEIGSDLGGLTVQDVSTLAEYCQKNRPQVAVLCIPTEGARQLAPTLLNLGVKGFWNFSHYDLSTSQQNVVVENVHLGDSLTSLGFQIRNAN
ncbi:MAG: redox-sensing transcriptional repressor Rex [Oscillospiraceae bacterium]